MCKGCWESFDAPTDLPENYQEIITRIETLYAAEGCSIGGPLHVELEDENVGLSWVPYPGSGRYTYSTDAMAKAQAVADLMLPLSEDQRRAVIGKWRGYF